MSESTDKTINEEAQNASRLEDDVLLVLPVRNLVVFPGAVTQVALGRELSIAAAKEAVNNERKLGILLQKDPAVDEPGPDDLHRVGTVVTAVRFLTAPNGMHYLICQGEHRFEFTSRKTASPKSRRWRRTFAPKPSRRWNCCRRRRLKWKRRCVLSNHRSCWQI
jgi:ATP-dependent Lon protease